MWSALQSYFHLHWFDDKTSTQFKSSSQWRQQQSEEVYSIHTCNSNALQLLLWTLEWCSIRCSISALSILPQVAASILNFHRLQTPVAIPNTSDFYRWLIWEPSMLWKMAFLFLFLFTTNSEDSQAWEMQHYEKEVLNYTQVISNARNPLHVSNVFITLVMISNARKVNNWTRVQTVRKAIIKNSHTGTLQQITFL